MTQALRPNVFEISQNSLSIHVPGVCNFVRINCTDTRYFIFLIVNSTGIV